MKPIYLLLLFSVAFVAAYTEEEEEDSMEDLWDDAQDQRVCTSRHKKYYYEPCNRHGAELWEKLKTTKLTSDNLPELAKECDKYHRCFFPLSCERNHEIAESGHKMEVICGLDIWLKTEFKDCATKLKETNNACYKSWGPPPKIIWMRIEYNKAEGERKRLAACDNYFGKDLCMEDAVLKTCGLPMWTKFRDHLTNLNSYLMKCKVPYEIPYHMDGGKPLIYEEWA